MNGLFEYYKVYYVGYTAVDISNVPQNLLLVMNHTADIREVPYVELQGKGRDHVQRYLSSLSGYWVENDGRDSCWAVIGYAPVSTHKVL